MKKLALAALAATAFTAPAFADGHAREVAVMIFNQSEDMASERTAITTEPMFVDITQDMTLAEVLDQINMNAAMSDDQIGNMFLTIVGNTNLAQDIFDDLAEQDDSEE